MKSIPLSMGILLCGASLLWSTVTHIHWGSKNNPLNGLTVTWQSYGPADSIRWGYTDLYEQGTFAGTQRADYSGYLYDYAFPAVQPSATIHYSIYDGTWGVEKTFQTSCDTIADRLTFITGGDIHDYNLPGWRTMAETLAQQDADFFIHMGDKATDGNSATDWDEIYSYGASLFEKALIYYAVSNHDYNYSIYYNQFVLPGEEKWYSFEFGDALFISLNSERDFAAQYAWLVDQLRNTAKKLKIVYFPKPFFVTVVHQQDMDAYRETWWKAFDDYGVDLVLNGHIHYYMRSKPINLNVNAETPVEEYGSGPGQGRLEMVLGNWGSGGYDGTPSYFSNTDWFVEKGAWALNYGKCRIHGDTLHMDVLDPYGLLLDSLTIIKRPQGPDTTAPFFRESGPSGTVRTASVLVTLKTNEPAYVRWGLVDQPYETMTTQFPSGEGGFNHSMVVAGVHGQTYVFYVRAIDDSGNSMDTSAVISFTVDTTCTSMSWKDPGYDDSSWPLGLAEFGYGDGNEATTIARVYTAYFRKSMSVSNPAPLSSLALELNYDDGVIVYLNGAEVARLGMPASQVGYDTWASTAHEGGTYTTVDITAQGLPLLHDGQNSIAAPVHQEGSGSSDISFDLALVSGTDTLVARKGQWRYSDIGREPDSIESCTSGPYSIPAAQVPEKSLMVFPNPFNPAVTIQCGKIPGKDGLVTVEIFRVNGSSVATVETTVAKISRNGVVWKAVGVSSGLYLFRLRAGDAFYSAKALLLR